MFKPEPKYTDDTNVNRIFQQQVPCVPKISQSFPWKMNSSLLKKEWLEDEHFPFVAL